MLNVTNLKEKQKSGNNILNMMVYGASGAGKTTLASTAADLGKILYVDAEAGAQFVDEKRAKNIDLVEMKNIETLDEVLKPENHKEYTTIVLDSITEIMKKLVDEIKGGKDSPTLQDWGKIINNMESYFRKFRDLNKHVILVAMETEKEDDNTILKRPSLSGKNLPADIIGFQDICMYLENTTQGRVGHVQPSVKFYAKDRTSKLPSKIEQKDLNVKYIVDMISVQPEPATEDQKKRIEKGVKDLGLDEEKINQMYVYGGADSLEELTSQGAEKILKAIDLKLSNQNQQDSNSDMNQEEAKEMEDKLQQMF